MVTSLLDLSKVIIRPMKDGNGKRTFKLGLIVTMSCNQWDSNAKNQSPPTRRSRSYFTFELSEVTLTPFLEPSQTKEPPIPGPSPSSQPPEDNTAHEPEPEVAPMQSTEEPF
ncbi:hypothetical protein O181_130525, partial [Austropuccinia psidii MF-1]|nr:hypothetical protein [Austropuccinia psidii MF-1]